jgi:DNA repair protein RadC
VKTIKKLEIRARRVRVEEPGAVYGETIKAPERAADLAAQLIDGDEQEVFLVFLLDVKNRILGFVEAARGGIDACMVDPRVVFRAAIVQGASAIIVAHNHPSGDTTPSAEDITLTKRLKDAGELVGVALLDHLVIADGSYVSLAERGLL